MPLLALAAPADAPPAQTFVIIPGYALFAVYAYGEMSDLPVTCVGEIEGTLVCITLIGAPLP